MFFLDQTIWLCLCRESASTSCNQTHFLQTLHLYFTCLFNFIYHKTVVLHRPLVSITWYLLEVQICRPQPMATQSETPVLVSGHQGLICPLGDSHVHSSLRPMTLSAILSLSYITGHLCSYFSPTCPGCPVREAWSS